MNCDFCNDDKDVIGVYCDNYYQYCIDCFELYLDKFVHNDEVKITDILKYFTLTRKSIM